jgi:hypothetical protein
MFILAQANDQNIHENVTSASFPINPTRLAYGGHVEPSKLSLSQRTDELNFAVPRRGRFRGSEDT